MNERTEVTLANGKTIFADDIAGTKKYSKEELLHLRFQIYVKMTWNIDFMEALGMLSKPLGEQGSVKMPTPSYLAQKGFQKIPDMDVFPLDLTGRPMTCEK